MSSQSYIILLLLLLLKICCPAGARQLTAVSKRARIQTRDAAFKPYSAGFEFHYIDEDTIHANDQFAARLTFEPRLPVLAIEDVDRHLDMIQCSPDGLLLQFDSRRKLKKAEETWAALEEFVVVTSHLGCNHDGERQPYLYERPFPFANAVLTRVEFLESHSRKRVHLHSSTLSLLLGKKLSIA